MAPSTIFLASVETLINQVLALDAHGLRLLAALEDSVIAVEVLSLGWTIYVLPGPEGIMLLGHYEEEPDVRLRGTTRALSRMARGEVDLGGEVEVFGDTDVARQLQIALEELEIDWEERLSVLTGDLIAHQVGVVWRRASRYARQTAHSLRMDLEEYLKEELRVLPQRYEVEGFLDGVDRLRDDMARAEARIKRLEQTLKKMK